MPDASRDSSKIANFPSSLNIATQTSLLAPARYSSFLDTPEQHSFPIRERRPGARETTAKGKTRRQPPQDAGYSRGGTIGDAIEYRRALGRAASTTSPGGLGPADDSCELGNGFERSRVSTNRAQPALPRCRAQRQPPTNRTARAAAQQRYLCATDARLSMAVERERIVSEPSPCLGACTRPWPCGVTMYRKILDISHSSCVT